jgi:hypothetical protein
VSITEEREQAALQLRCRRGARAGEVPGDAAHEITAGALEHQGPVAEGDNLLQKPFTADSLGHAVREALTRPAKGV